MASILDRDLLICIGNIGSKDKISETTLQEVIHGQTPLIAPEMEGWPGQKLTDRITRIKEFKR